MNRSEKIGPISNKGLGIGFLLLTVFCLAAFSNAVAAGDSATPTVGFVLPSTPGKKVSSTGFDLTPHPLKNWHVFQAELYEQRAAQMADAIAQHEDMKANYKGPADFAAHCDAIIRSLKKLKADYENFAKWHREQAAASGGQ